MSEWFTVMLFSLILTHHLVYKLNNQHHLVYKLNNQPCQQWELVHWVKGNDAELFSWIKLVVQSGMACLHVDQLTSLNTESTPAETHEKWGMCVCVCVCAYVCVVGVCVVGGGGRGGGTLPKSVKPMHTIKIQVCLNATHRSLSQPPWAKICPLHQPKAE